MESGGIALLNYGERPVLWHTRLLLAPTTGSNWVVVTPDHDIFEEEMAGSNVDLTGFHYCGPSGQIPPHIPAARVYGFQPLTPAELGQFMTQGRALAAQLNPAPAGAPPSAAPGVAPVANPVVINDSWVAMEQLGHFKRGDVIAVDPSPLPQGAVILGDRAIMPVGGGSIALCKMPASEVLSFTLEDLRVLPVHFDAEGSRRREFNRCVELMRGESPQGGGLQLTGPPTCLNLMKSLRDQGFTPSTFHEHWIRASEIPRGDRSTYEHECLSRILESMICVDQINAPALQSAELVCRRMLVIREAHRVNPSSPDYSAADHYMGWKYRRSGQGLDASLAAHVASELKAEAQVAKEARKAREEQNLRRADGKGRHNPKKGGDGGNEK